MKVVSKLAMAVAIASAATFSMNAQKFDAGIQITPSLPLGDFGDNVSFGIGGKILGNYYFNENVHLGLEIGFISYGYKDIEVPGVGTVEVDGNLHLVPIQLTGAYHIDADADLDIYFGTGVGLFIASSTVGDSDSKSYFGLSPRVGISYALTDELRLDANLAFNYVITSKEDIGGVEFNPYDYTALNLNVGVTYTLWD